MRINVNSFVYGIEGLVLRPRLTPALHIGDGPWDARAAVELGYRFVGVANRRDAELLTKQGAASVIPDFDSSNHAELLAELLY